MPSEGEARKRASAADPAIGAALHAIHRDPARHWTVATLAAAAGLSRAAFSKRFTAMIGQPPLTYLTWWRMTTAARLLHASDTPLGQVAAQTGYTSEFAFATAFKREYGTAPAGTADPNKKRSDRSMASRPWEVRRGRCVETPADPLAGGLRPFTGDAGLRLFAGDAGVRRLA